MTIHFELVTPERVLYREEVDEVTLPTSEGEITILQNHIPLVASLVAGVASIKKNDATEDIAVSGGFIEVQKGNTVRVLADTAERGHELDLSVIEQAKQRAENVMKETVRTDDAAYAAAAAALERELARYKVARKRRGAAHAPIIDLANLPSDKNPV
jgi:F-type H+-transporting ATPase subunit epsilon